MHMNKPPAFSFYAQDFLTGVMYLTNEEKGMYITMLCKQWTDKRIPKKRLGFIIGKGWDNLSEELKSKFVDKGEYIVNERLEKERKKKYSYLKKQSENGKRGGRPKKIEKNKKPNKTQKKPLEKENEIEDRKQNTENGNKKLEDENKKRLIIFPFDTQEFKDAWNNWKEYKKTEFNFKFKSLQSEQAQLKKLSNMVSTPEDAISILEQSMANGWKGLFDLQPEKIKKDDPKYREKRKQELEDFYRKKAAAKFAKQG